jgi:SAM-dependent methyltransferase
VAPPPGARVLEVGCGPAVFWQANGDRIDLTWQLTLTDASAGMVEAARGVLGDRAQFLVADVQELPFPDGTFDVVLANHMLYHVADRRRAVDELARVLAHGGRLHAATNGRGHMRQLHELVGGDWDLSRHTELFGLETGAELLARAFVDVRVERHDSDLAVTEVEPVVGYVASSLTFAGDVERVRREVERAIARDGVFRIDKTAGVLHARRP